MTHFNDNKNFHTFNEKTRQKNSKNEKRVASTNFFTEYFRDFSHDDLTVIS